MIEFQRVPAPAETAGPCSCGFQCVPQSLVSAVLWYMSTIMVLMNFSQLFPVRISRCV